MISNLVLATDTLVSNAYTKNVTAVLRRLCYSTTCSAGFDVIFLGFPWHDTSQNKTQPAIII